MPDMTQELKDQRRRDFDHTLRDIAPELAKATDKIQTVVDSLAHLATVLPGKEPLERERLLAAAALKRLGAVSRGVEKVQALTDELLNK